MSKKKIIVIIVSLLIAVNETKKLIDVLDELRKFDTDVLQEALDRVPEEPENRTVVKVIPSSPKTVREKFNDHLIRMIIKLKDH